jgi:hypothetical protein
VDGGHNLCHGAWPRVIARGGSGLRNLLPDSRRLRRARPRSAASRHPDTSGSCDEPLSRYLRAHLSSSGSGSMRDIELSSRAAATCRLRSASRSSDRYGLLHPASTRSIVFGIDAYVLSAVGLAGCSYLSECMRFRILGERSCVLVYQLLAIDITGGRTGSLGDRLGSFVKSVRPN